jgi:putative ABC transport system permease protein
MSTAVRDRPATDAGHGGMHARRAVLRWAWRLFRREWRQQSLILVLLLIAVAATTIGLALATNSSAGQAARFGTADRLVTVDSTGGRLDTDLAALRTAFGPTDVIGHRQIAVPGSANPIDLRTQDPHGPYGAPMLRLDDGRYPHGPDEVAVTAGVAEVFGLTVGDGWTVDGRHRTVTGLVENPLNLRDRFALVAPGQIAGADAVTVLIRMGTTRSAFPDGSSVEVRGDRTDNGSVMVLLLATIGLLFVGLLAVAGFTVLAQRRLRSLGMLTAIGAAHRHVRLALVANGTVTGAAGALAGAAVGLGAWLVLGPRLESAVGHRIDRFDLPWLTILAAVLLAVLTTTGAAWWPARAAARVPVVAALSARPAPPRPAHRLAAAGAVLLAGGLGALVLAQRSKPAYIIGGTVATALGLLLLAPLGIAGLGRLARFAPIATRLAWRDLARYRARSGAALAAIALAVGIAAVVALSAAVAVAEAAVPTGGNLPADQAVVWLSGEGRDGPVASLTAAQVSGARAQVDAIAADLHAGSTLGLQVAVDPTGPRARGSAGGREPMRLAEPHPTKVDGRSGVRYSSDDAVPLFVATPQLLRRYGIDPASIDPRTDIVTSRTDLDGYDLIPGRYETWRPTFQHAALPTYSSLPTTLITERAVRALHLAPTAAGWLVRAPRPLAPADVDRARRAAAAGGLTLESRPTGADIARLADYATAAGIAVALGVLISTVGLIRGETARDLRTLTAAGARRRTRRALTVATAGSLGLLGAVLGTTGAYAALLAWHHRDPHWLTHVPATQLAAILIGLPLAAYAGAWLLAGKEPPALARQPME